MTTTKTLPSGVLAQKNNFYALRILGSACEFTVDELTAVAALSQKFGGGQVTATSRGTLEINQIPAEKLDAAIAATQAAHLYLGGTGTTVRAVVACKGTCCRRGLFDVTALAQELQTALLGQTVPKKFKIGVFGCMNSTGKARSQDFGILPSVKELGKFEISLGGMMGKSPALGYTIERTFTREQIFSAVQIVLEKYRAHGDKGERLRHLFDRQPQVLEEIKQALQAL